MTFDTCMNMNNDDAIVEQWGKRSAGEGNKEAGKNRESCRMSRHRWACLPLPGLFGAGCRWLTLSEGRTGHTKTSSIRLETQLKRYPPRQFRLWVEDGKKQKSPKSPIWFRVREEHKTPVWTRLRFEEIGDNHAAPLGHLSSFKQSQRNQYNTKTPSFLHSIARKGRDKSDPIDKSSSRTQLNYIHVRHRFFLHVSENPRGPDTHAPLHTPSPSYA